MTSVNRENTKTFESLRKQLLRHLTAAGNVTALSTEFGALKYDFQRVNFVQELLNTFQIEADFEKDAKNDEVATKLREKGNEMFKVKKLKEAWEFYTKSICHSEDKSVNLGLAYANRSAVLFELNLHKQCLKDIGRALSNNYPEHIKEKLIVREKNSKNLEVEAFKLPHEEIPSIIEENVKIQSASNCLEIKENKNFGRYVVTTKDIKAGDVLAVEKPFVSLLVDQFFNHCHHCITLCYNLIPCKSCTNSMYCSESCRDEAFEKYHKYECPILLTIKKLNFDKLKVLPLKIALLVKNDYQEINELNIEGLDETYYSNRYREIHNLVANSSKRSVSDLFERATAAAIIFNLVKSHTIFFDDLQDYENTFKQLLLLHMQTGPSNFHEITELRPNENGFCELSEIGSGAFSFLSMLNHSCSPNVTRFCYGTTIVLRAIQNIAKGEQCFDNYGYHFAVMDKSERQKHLKNQYYFDCVCQACESNWSTYDGLSLSSNSEEEVDDLIMAKLSKGEVETAKTVLGDLVEKLQRLQSFQPCQNFCKVQEAVKQCFAVFANKRQLL